MSKTLEGIDCPELQEMLLKQGKTVSRYGIGRRTACLLTALTLLMLFSLFLPVSGLRPAKGSPGSSLFGVKVCLDPGHGGEDPGAVGPTGLKEKDVNLKVALKLKALLEAEGASVLLTRADDRYVSLSDRCQIANSWRADIFVSIHHNSVSDPSVNGTETLISPAAGDFTRQLANSIQAELVAELKLTNRGVKERSLYVLNNTFMPAVLTEASFISNPDEEKRLRDDAYLEREARAILRGIKVPARISFVSPREGMVAGKNVRVSLQVVSEELVERVEVSLEGVGEMTRTAPPFDFDFGLSGGQDGERRVSATVRYRDGSTFSAGRTVLCAPSATRWYFAEGCTREGFDPWLTLFNPGLEEAIVSVSYAFAEGDAVFRTYSVPGMTRRTVNVAGEVGRGKDVSMMVESELPVLAERPMYFLYKGKWAGGHVSPGVNQPSVRWYFAEGYTGEGFEQWLCLFNPGMEPAGVTVEYFSRGGKVKERRLEVPALKRVTLDVNRDVGPGMEVSTLITADRPVVAERPMYFLYKGKWAGGHVSPGVNQPSVRWYFAEGYTGEGFEQWLCLFNPSEETSEAEVTFRTSGGERRDARYLVPPWGRATVFVNGEVGPGKEVALEVRSGTPLMVERPIYYSYRGSIAGGDVGMPVSSPSRHWYFSEGYTGEGFYEWLCFLNPGQAGARVQVVLVGESGRQVYRDAVIPPGYRLTMNVNSEFGSMESVSAEIHSDAAIVVERPMYFSYGRGWRGGHLSPGFRLP